MTTFNTRAIGIGGLILGLTLCAGCDQAASQGTTSNGVPNGEWVYYFPTGQRQKAGPYLNGVQQGEWSFWYESGQVKQRGNYKDGQAQGVWTYWHDNGQKSKQGPFVDGREHGHWIYWHPNGQRAAEGDFRGGEQFGVWITWTEKGARKLQLYTQSLPAELQALTAQVKSGDEAARRLAASQLAAKEDEGLPALGSVLQGGDQLGKKVAAEAISTLGPKAAAAAPLLVDLLVDPNIGVNKAAQAALVAIGGESVGGLRLALSATDPRVRTLVCESLGELGQAAIEAQSDLITMTNDPNIEVVRAATLALGKLGPTSLPALKKAVRSPRVEVRVGAAEAMGFLAPKETAALDALVLCLDERDPTVVDAICASLKAFGEPAVERIVAQLVADDANVRDHACLALGRMGQTALPAIVKLSNSREPRMRMYAAICIGHLGSAGADGQSLLQKLKNDSDESVRYYAAEASKKIKP